VTMLTLLANSIDIGPNLLQAIIAVIGFVTLIARQEKVNRTLKPNGGSSIYDAIKRIEDRMDERTEIIENVLARLDTLEDAIKERNDP